MLPERSNFLTLSQNPIRTGKRAGMLLACLFLTFCAFGCSIGPDYSFVQGNHRIVIDPKEVTLPTGGTTTFHWSERAGNHVSKVAWFLHGFQNSNQNGQIDQNGHYTAPGQPGDYQIDVRPLNADGTQYTGESHDPFYTEPATVHVIPGPGQASITVQ